MTKPMVAIVGRPNVGKSTLFNRLVGKPLAIVHELPGTTRDRIYADTSWEGRELTVVDTGGLEVSPTTSLLEQVRNQVEQAIAEADVILFLVDGGQGLVPADEEIAQWLRRSSKPLLLVANKVDNPQRIANVAEFYQLGMGDPLPVSAYHGKGAAELLDRLLEVMPTPPAPEEEKGLIKVAIVGRPNVGKSLLLNAILGQERAIVHELPGTTRDALDTLFQYDGQHCLLIDTAGIRRRGRVEVGVEKYSVLRALRAISRADVAVLVAEATQPLLAQDLHIAGYIHQAFKGLVLVFNKWDLVEVRDAEPYIKEVSQKLRFMPYVPILFTSAKVGWGVGEVLAKAAEVYGERQRTIASPQLQDWLEQALEAHSPPSRGPKRVKFFSLSQVQVNPPTFCFRVNDPEMVHFSFQRYLENRLRSSFGFSGTPLRLTFKGGK